MAAYDAAYATPAMTPGSPTPPPPPPPPQEVTNTFLGKISLGDLRVTGTYHNKALDKAHTVTEPRLQTFALHLRYPPRLSSSMPSDSTRLVEYENFRGITRPCHGKWGYDSFRGMLRALFDFDGRNDDNHLKHVYLFRESTNNECKIRFVGEDWANREVEVRFESLEQLQWVSVFGLREYRLTWVRTDRTDHWTEFFPDFGSGAFEQRKRFRQFA